MAETTLPVEHLFDITAATNVSGFIASGPQGGRAIVDAGSGTFEGPAGKGTVVGPGGDWVTIQPDGHMRLDVRLLLKTDDGADILMTYRGVGAPGATSLRTAPLFETADERYAFLDTVQAVGIGSSDGSSVSYQVYRLL